MNRSLGKTSPEADGCVFSGSIVYLVNYRAFAEMHNTDDPDYEAVANALMPAGESRIWNNAIMELGGVACG